MSRRRGILSGVMTVWGVFIFIAVVGTGNGIDKGNRTNYDFMLQYSMISVRTGEISIPREGLIKGRKIVLTRSDAEEMKVLFSDCSQNIFPRKQFTANCESLTASADAVISDFHEGIYKVHLKYIAGRSFSPVEQMGRDRICLIHETVAEQLFGSVRDAVGATLDINRLPYTVVGVYRTVHEVLMRDIFVPFETAMAMQGTDETLSSIDIKLTSGVPASERYRLKADIESWLCFRKGISNDDDSAAHIEESIAFISEQEKFLDSIRYFTEILGMLSLLMGILGVSSIVHLSVKERTKEIAVRLVCGSSESSIFRLILGESVMIMLIFGIIGMLLGSLALNVVNIFVEKLNVGYRWVYIDDLSASWQLILSATVLVVICGLIAGFAPARKATSIRINEAMSCE